MINIYVYMCVFFSTWFFFPMFSDSKCALFATGVLPGLFALPGSCPLHGCRKTPSGGKWSLSRKDPKYQWKISKYGRVFGFHLDDIFQVVCDWEFSPERSPLFSWNVLQNDLLHNLCYIVLASELSRKSGHPSCRNWSLLSCLVSFLATHDHRTRSGSSRVKEPHAMKCFLDTFQLDSHGNGGQSTQTVSVKLFFARFSSWHMKFLLWRTCSTLHGGWVPELAGRDQENANTPESCEATWPPGSNKNDRRYWDPESTLGFGGFLEGSWPSN